MIAFDADDGENGRITYSIVSTEEVGDRKRRSTDDVTDRFKIHPHRGVIWSQKEFVAGEVFDLVVSVEADVKKRHYPTHSTVQHLKPATFVAHVFEIYKFICLGHVFTQVQASDNGRTIQRNDTTHVTFTVLIRPTSSPHAPVFDRHDVVEEVFEDFEVGTHVTSPVATDEDGDRLWYSIEDGNVDDAFAVDTQTGSIILARPLDRERRALYNLTLQASDCVHSVRTSVRHDVIFEKQPALMTSRFVVFL